MPDGEYQVEGLNGHFHVMQAVRVMAGKATEGSTSAQIKPGDPFLAMEFAGVCDNHPDDPPQIEFVTVLGLRDEREIRMAEKMVDSLTLAVRGARAAAHYDPDEIVQCLMCNRRLFGLVKVRGVCFDCVPDADADAPA